ncbi:AMP-binding protein [Microbacterium sp. ANT_H45B]|uniref:AMP-binding protein n=1 Tax=Microbacterium sp. ANT_H45B TaxID=2597346 RepID=UPI0011EEA992|nr:AMP-binding protein [Microbacterium sp. ANT_H45B]KAA0960100.1 AMP-binding protein [Microbacterium sp. ANT_H45B]
MSVHEPEFDATTPFVEVLRRWAEHAPDRPAVSDPDRTLSRAQLDADSDALADAFAAQGVRAGSLVTIALPNEVAFFTAVVAAWKVGATPQPVSSRSPDAELARVLELAKPALVVGRRVDGVPSIDLPLQGGRESGGDRRPGVVAASWKAPLSGGSTGAPKLIVSTLPARYGSLAPFAPLVRMRSQGISIIPTPLSHNMGLLFGTLTLLTGGEVVILPRFTPESFVRVIDERRATWAIAVPTMLHRTERLLTEGGLADLSSLEAVAVGASACPQRLKEFWADRLGPERMIEFYSTTENQVIALADGGTWRSHPGSVGRVVVGELEVRDDTGAAVPEGTVGELWMRRGATEPIPYRYLGAQARRDDDGWDSVGDLGSIRNGYVYLADRASDMIIVGGSNVYPAEVEAALEEHPSVQSSCVIGLPDDEYGSRLHAIVQASSPLTAEELIAHLRERLTPYKIPRTYTWTASAIRDDAGKVRRSAWREKVLSEQY